MTNTMNKYATPKTQALVDQHCATYVDNLNAWVQMTVLARQLERALRVVVESPHFYDMDGLTQELVNAALELPTEETKEP